MNKEERLGAGRERHVGDTVNPLSVAIKQAYDNGWVPRCIYEQLLAERALTEPTPTRDPETCWHVFLTKQTGPLDGGPAKSKRYRCQECGTFLVAEPYGVEVTIGPKS